MNIRNILFYKVFFNNVRREEEYQILNRLKEARIREKILSAAIVHGADVQDDLEQTKSQIIDLINRIPRGDNRSFYAFCIWYTLFISYFVCIYRNLHPFIMEEWGSLDNWYLQRFRAGSVQIYQAGRFITSSIWFAVIAALLLLLLWYIQKRLQYHWSQRLITIIAVLERS